MTLVSKKARASMQISDALSFAINVNGLSHDTDLDASGHTYDQTNGPHRGPPYV